MDFFAYLARIAAPDLAAGREGSKAEAGKSSLKGGARDPRIDARSVDEDISRMLFGQLPSTGTVVTRPSEDDGSCFYHSLAQIVNFQGCFFEAQGDRRRAGLELRRRLVARVGSQEDWEAYWSKQHGVRSTSVPSAKEVKARLRDSKVWADPYTILFATHQLELNPLFVDFTTKKPYCGVTLDSRTAHDMSQAPLNGGKNLPAQLDLPKCQNRLCLIAWKGHTHFEPMAMRIHRDALQAPQDMGVYSLGTHAYVTMFSGNARRNLLTVYHDAMCPNISVRDVIQTSNPRAVST